MTKILIRDAGRSPGKAKDGGREICEFHTLGSDCLQITFADGHLWWCFAEPEVTWLGLEEDEQVSRMRRTLSGWRNTNLKGEALHVEALSSWLTQVAAYRQTIYSLAARDHLLHRINGIN